MAMSIGIVAINPTTAAVSGGGMARAIFNARQARLDAGVAAGVAAAAAKLIAATADLVAAQAELSSATLPQAQAFAQIKVDSAQRMVDMYTSQANATAQKVPIYQGAADEANEMATALVPYLTAQMGVVVDVPTSASGLQRMPAVTTVDTDTKGPAVAKTLFGSVT